MGQVPNPKNYRKDEKMRKRNIKINVFINEEEQIRFKNKVKKQNFRKCIISKFFYLLSFWQAQRRLLAIISYLKCESSVEKYS